ncbi:MAG TPA: ATP-binding protein [Ktedonobacteraceae bacterium]|jgi:signal transduction histidine kinase|nr:ATP-binding protein [Ktedonobacteraceae bacterium]
MKRRNFFHALHAFSSSVRVRLTLWYLAIMAFIMFLFGGSLYATQTFLNPSTTNSRLESQLYLDAQQLEANYKQTILQGKSPTTQKETLSSGEFVLLLRPDKTVLDKRGPLSNSIIQQLQLRVENSQPGIDLTMPQSHYNGWHGTDRDYRVLFTPILNQNSRIAILIIGLPKPFPVVVLPIWLFHGMLGLLAAAIGGYWLAGKTLSPVKMITRTANEISATDLRRRLDLKRKDEFGQLATTFDQMLDRLEAAFKRQAQFTADASHELRTPLTIIDLEINRALTQLHTFEGYRQVLEVIQSENEQMTAIVNSLLLLARADTGQIALHRQEVDLSDIALASVERLLSLARQSEITLSTGDLPELLIQGDQHYLSRMTMNLVENAIKYTRGVGKHVHVELAEEADTWGIIRVKDDGPGIAKEHLPYLFDRFYRVDKARTHNRQASLVVQPRGEEPGGIGLGLSIVQWIVQDHHGEVQVESSMGKGSTFEVRLPLLKKAE